MGASCVTCSPIFYGYVVAFIGTVGMVATGPGQTPVIGTIITAIDHDLAISRTATSSLYLTATVCSACTLPLVGRVLDHLGPPPVFCIVVLGLGLTCILFASFAQNSLFLGLCFYCLRLFGQGSLTLVCQNAVNLWFDKKRGRVMGTCSFFTALCLTGLFSSWAKRQVANVGWRSTYRLLGFIELFCVLPLGACFLKQKPEFYGLIPDGNFATTDLTDKTPQSAKRVDSATEEFRPLKEPSNGKISHNGQVPVTAEDSLEMADVEQLSSDIVGGPGGHGTSGPLPVQIGCATYAPSDDKRGVDSMDDELQETIETCDFTFSQAIRTFAFWSMSFGALTSAALGTAVFFHLDAIFSGPDHSTHLNWVYLSAAPTAGATTLITGVLIDIVRPQYIMTTSLLCLATMLCISGLIVKLQMVPEWLFLVGILNGLSSGGFNICVGVSYAKWFGRTHNGKIQGLASSMVVLGSALGPAVVSLGSDIFGQYHDVMFLVALWPLLCAVLTVCAREPSQAN